MRPAEPYETVAFKSQAERCERDVLRALGLNAAAGAAAGFVFVAVIVGMDITGLRSLIMNEPNGPLALCLLLGGVSTTWGLIAAATALTFGIDANDQQKGGRFVADQRQTAPGLRLSAIAVRTGKSKHSGRS